MQEISGYLLPLFATGLCIILTYVLGKFFIGQFSQLKSIKLLSQENSTSEEEVVAAITSSSDVTITSLVSKSSVKPAKSGKGSSRFEHEDLLCSLGGHAGSIVELVVSPNNKYVASCAADRSILAWSVKDLFTHQLQRKSIRGKVVLDDSVCLAFSPDSKALGIGVEQKNTVQIHRFVKNDQVSSNYSLVQAFDFPSNILTSEIKSLGISSSGLFVMVAEACGILRILSLKGEELASPINVAVGGKLIHAEVSPCGRFVAACGRSSELKLHLLSFNKEGGFESTKQVMLFKGHTGWIVWFAISLDSTRLLTVSKDGTFRMWRIDVRYQDREDPQTLLNGSHCLSMEDDSSVRCALSFNGLCFALADPHKCHIYSGVSGDLQKTIEPPSHISSLAFDNLGKVLLIASGKQVLAFKNAIQLEATVESFERQLAKEGATMNAANRSRLEARVDEAKANLNSFLELTV